MTIIYGVDIVRPGQAVRLLDGGAVLPYEHVPGQPPPQIITRPTPAGQCPSCGARQTERRRDGRTACAYCGGDR